MYSYVSVNSLLLHVHNVNNISVWVFPLECNVSVNSLLLHVHNVNNISVWVFPLE